MLFNFVKILFIYELRYLPLKDGTALRFQNPLSIKIKRLKLRIDLDWNEWSRGSLLARVLRLGGNVNAFHFRVFFSPIM